MPYCFQCMAKLTEGERICHKCGHDNKFHDNGPGNLPYCVLQDNYVIGRALGRGGFGVTYLAYDQLLDRKIAIKEYFPTSLAIRDPHSMQILPYNGQVAAEYAHGVDRAIHEARTVVSLESIPNVLKIYGVFRANNTVYIVMEYVEGVTLEQYLSTRGGKLSWSQAWCLLRPIMAALGEIHRHGIVHRDVSPENIMIRTDGTPVLLDFGIAQQSTRGTTTHSAALRIGFAPYEQYSENAPQDGRTDEYAMMATLYYVLTHAKPASPLNVSIGMEHLTPPRLKGADIPEAVEAVMLKGLSVQMDNRYPTMESLLSAFDDAMHFGETQIVSGTSARRDSMKTAMPGGHPEQMQRQKKSSSIPLVIKILLSIIIILSVSFKPYQYFRHYFQGEYADLTPDSSVTESAHTAMDVSSHGSADTDHAGNAESQESGNEHSEEKALAFASTAITQKPTDIVTPAPTYTPTMTPTETPAETPTAAVTPFISVTPTVASTVSLTKTVAQIQPTNVPAPQATSTPSGYSYVEDLDLSHYTLSRSDGKTVIKSYSGSEPYLKIPDQLNGIDVAIISEKAFAGNKSLIAVDMPRHLVKIKASAFSKCENLEHVVFHNGLERIEDKAFFYCRMLGNFELPNTIVFLGQSAFEGCESLTYVYIPRSLRMLGGYPFRHITPTIEVDPGNTYMTIMNGALVETH